MTGAGAEHDGDVTEEPLHHGLANLSGGSTVHCDVCVTATYPVDAVSRPGGQFPFVGAAPLPGLGGVHLICGRVMYKVPTHCRTCLLVQPTAPGTTLGLLTEASVIQSETRAPVSGSRNSTGARSRTASFSPSPSMKLKDST